MNARTFVPRRMPTTGNAQAIQQHLEGVDFPADKQRLLQVVRDNNAPGDVVEQIRSLPDQEFGGPDDVMKAVGRR